MVPAFVNRKLVDEARQQAKAKRPGTPYELAKLVTIREGRSVQMMHVGPWDKEQPTIDALNAWMTEHSLVQNGKHHEIYISDPNRTKPEKLKTVIRLGVKAASKKTR